MIPGLAVQQVVYDMERTPARMYTGTKRPNSCSRCQCLACGAVLAAFTEPHAHKHGYENKEAMIKAGVIKWL